MKPAQYFKFAHFSISSDSKASSVLSAASSPPSLVGTHASRSNCFLHTFHDEFLGDPARGQLIEEGVD